MESEKIFNELYAINVNDKTEQKNGLTYLSWAYAWAEFKKHCPDATYEIVKFDGAPYFYDENLGYMCYTRVTANGQTHEMWLPVMDGANKAMKSHPYEYTVKNNSFKYAKQAQDGKYYDRYGNEQTEYVTKTVEAATMFDVNKTIMRCLTKNLAMFGLGLYIYAGEDLPEQVAELMTAEHLAELNDLCGKVHVENIAKKVAQRYKAKDLQSMEDKYFQKAKADLMAQIELEEKAKKNEAERNA